MGGEAIANADNVADWEGGKRLINAAIEAFGDLHMLVNNAGILRDRVLVNMTEEEWDAVIHVHLKGHFVPDTLGRGLLARADQGGSGTVKATVINTSSTSGLLGNPGQTNYGAAKAGIAAFSRDLRPGAGRYGVRVNAIAPAARTRMTEATRRVWATSCRRPTDPAKFDIWNPANISPLVAWLRHRGLPGHGQGVLRAGRQGAELSALDADGRPSTRPTAGPSPSSRRRWRSCSLGPLTGGLVRSGQLSIAA